MYKPQIIILFIIQSYTSMQTNHGFEVCFYFSIVRHSQAKMLDLANLGNLGAHILQFVYGLLIDYGMQSNVWHRIKFMFQPIIGYNRLSVHASLGILCTV